MAMEGLIIAVATIIILTSFCMIITICWAVWRNYRGKWQFRGGRLRRRSLYVCAMPARTPRNFYNDTGSGMGPNDPLPVGFKDVQPDPFEVLRIPQPYPKHMPYIPNTAAAPYFEASMRGAAAPLVPTAPPASPDDPCPQNNVAAPPCSVAAPPYPVAGSPYPAADIRQHEPPRTCQ